jgi:hypothetical protein
MSIWPTGWTASDSTRPTPRRKQVAHEAARQRVADLGEDLHRFLPPGRDKSIVFTLLEDVLMRANKALAVGGGPTSGGRPCAA